MRLVSGDRRLPVALSACAGRYQLCWQADAVGAGLFS